MKISKDKKYTLRNGLPVIIHDIVDGDVIGSVMTSIGRRAFVWSEETGMFNGDAHNSCNGLVEISPYADFKIDDKVLVWEVNTSSKSKRHFAGISEDGNPMAWSDGQTSFTSDLKTEWDHCIKYEEQENDKI